MNKNQPHINFSQQVLSWFDHSGRKDLPWQQDINPYRVWLSEIMLQQTQVKTVIPFFKHFTDTLPTIEDLAAASEDQVLHLWTGLGYYTRARNLHKTAQRICSDQNGQLPATVEELCDLPGIGRSTAGAIVSIAFQQPAAILDGNVKRVLARFHGVDGWPGQSKVLKKLWAYSEACSPSDRVADYSQAIMDLGATLCVRSKPTCPQCPLKKECVAFSQGKQKDFPGKKPKKTLPVKYTQMLIIKNPNNELLLEKRPSSGVWGGLWIFPQLNNEDDAQRYCIDKLGLKPSQIDHWHTYRHTFSHYHLDISPVVIQLPKHSSMVMEDNQRLWYNMQKPLEVGLAAPIKKLMAKLT
jgi:A/G-specific adenine glycosylase